ncbi:sigma-70 family RNA polymerase sigma factor [Wenzhouxiangella sp. XN24]|uniref:RNA polymerase sigma factor n=1 Tax=Wenzhouxiangella sp. XN24 TaxID=2713569 RepID=UPI0013EDD1B0|nr:sigma-70 family RNA polymerase sigma factor [Wenzhouxiangella sp. XN24]NGX15948.1 sigma-70 family RNA polymerase sigma factor [Wenzhouxiangella sp. XN24]
MAEPLLKRVANGDGNAIKEVMDQFGGLVWSLARRSCYNPTDAEDATQEIFLDIWKSASRYDESKGSETLFVAMIARRRLIDRIRRQGREPRMDDIDAPGFELASNTQDEGETFAEAALAAKAVATLKPAQQRVLELGLLQGLSHSEIADMTGMPLGTVKTQMRRGLIRVRELMQVADLADAGEHS